MIPRFVIWVVPLVINSALFVVAIFFLCRKPRPEIEHNPTWRRASWLAPLLAIVALSVSCGLHYSSSPEEMSGLMGFATIGLVISPFIALLLISIPCRHDAGVLQATGIISTTLTLIGAGIVTLIAIADTVFSSSGPPTLPADWLFWGITMVFFMLEWLIALLWILIAAGMLIARRNRLGPQGNFQ